MYRFITQPGMPIALAIAFVLVLGWIASKLWPDLDWAIRAAASVVVLAGGALAIAVAVANNRPRE